MTTTHAVTIQQTARPRGFPTAGLFSFVESPVPSPGPGEALVENLYLSVDPYHREEMDGGWELNAPLEGRAVGRVVASRDPSLAEGDLVHHRQGWRSHALITAGSPGVRRLPSYEGPAGSGQSTSPSRQSKTSAPDAGGSARPAAPRT